MIKRLCPEHLSAVASLEEQSFAEPWSEQSLALLTREGAVGFVCLDKDSVLAYGGMIYVLDEGQITNIATDKCARRQGHASAVLDALCGFARENKLSEITLEVRSSNSSAISLYKKHGFETVGLRNGFYKHPAEDALIMKKHINGEI